MRNGYLCMIIVSIFIMAASFPSCAVKKTKELSADKKKGPLVSQASKSFEPRRINEIAILTLEVDDPEKNLLSNREAVTLELIKALQLNTSLNIFNIRNGDKVSEAENSVRLEPVSLKERAAKVGRILGVQGIICGIVSSNGDFGKMQDEGDVASSVGFKLWLVDVRSGNILWEGSFSHSNQSLTDNILNARDMISRKLKSETPREMFNDGFVYVAKELEDLRTAAFVDKKFQ